MAYRTWMCVVCGFIYDEAKGLPEDGIAAGTRWEDIPDSWTCPDCGVTKADFEMMPALEFSARKYACPLYFHQQRPHGLFVAGARCICR